MTGKETCKILKEIRQKIANENDIPLYTEECQYKGKCKGLLNIAAVTGLSFALSSCQTQSSADEVSTDTPHVQGNPVENTTDQPISDSIIPTISSPELTELSNTDDLMGDIPYEPSPHHDEIFLRLQQS